MDQALKMSDELKALVERAKARHVTRDDVRRQREAFVYGNLPLNKVATRADVRQQLARVEEPE